MPDYSSLSSLLRRIRDNDTNYEQRARLVLMALGRAVAQGYTAGIRIDPESPEWPVVYIELPGGQVSWHMPQHKQPWDGHTTAEKYRRIEAFSAR